MRFVVDTQLPPALARMLAAKGHEAEHVTDIGLRDAGDPLIWNYALKHGAVVLTKDEDFSRRVQQSAVPVVIIWLRIGNTSRRALLEWFEPLLPKIAALVGNGDRLIEIR